MSIFYVRNGQLRAVGLIPGSIEDSLKKWEYLKKLTSRGILVKDQGSRTCSLCLEYHNRPHCSSCPVAEATGQPYCAGTPLVDYRQSIVDRDVMAAFDAAAMMVELLAKLWRQK